jgi:diguanylate cyclase (GGDEF)-like protein
VRLGGDEFAVLLPGVSGSALAGWVDQVSRSLNDDCRVMDRDWPLRATIGAATYRPADGDGSAALSTLLAAADAAMYRARQERRTGAFADEPIPATVTGVPTTI